MAEIQNFQNCDWIFKKKGKKAIDLYKYWLSKHLVYTKCPINSAACIENHNSMAFLKKFRNPNGFGDIRQKPKLSNITFFNEFI